MTSFSLDPLFDLAKYALQVCLHTFPTQASHNLLRSRKKKEGNAMICLGEEPNSFERYESTIRGVHVNYALFQKVYKNIQVTKIRKWDEMTLFQNRSTFNHSRRYVSHSTYPIGMW